MERAMGWHIPLFLAFVIIGAIQAQKNHLIRTRKRLDEECGGMT